MRVIIAFVYLFFFFFLSSHVSCWLAACLSWFCVALAFSLSFLALSLSSYLRLPRLALPCLAALTYLVFSSLRVFSLSFLPLCACVSVCVSCVSVQLGTQQQPDKYRYGGQCRVIDNACPIGRFLEVENQVRVNIGIYSFSNLY